MFTARSTPYTLKSSTTVETGPAIKIKIYLLNPISFQYFSTSIPIPGSNRQCKPSWVLPSPFYCIPLAIKIDTEILYTFTTLHRARLLMAPVLHLWTPPRQFTDDQVLMDSLHAKHFPWKNVFLRRSYEITSATP